MKTTSAAVLAIVLLSGAAGAQETKPVPKDSMRVRIPGCTKGYIFTVAPRTIETAGSVDLPPGLHIRMNAPKKVMQEIKGHEGSMIELTGLMKKGQYDTRGLAVGGGVRIGGGGPPVAGGGGGLGSPVAGQAQIDVEGWRQIAGECPGS